MKTPAILMASARAKWKVVELIRAFGSVVHTVVLVFER
jgi:hypothetical protein